MASVRVFGLARLSVGGAACCRVDLALWRAVVWACRRVGMLACWSVGVLEWFDCLPCASVGVFSSWQGLSGLVGGVWCVSLSLCLRMCGRCWYWWCWLLVVCVLCRARACVRAKLCERVREVLLNAGGPNGNKPDSGRGFSV